MSYFFIIFWVIVIIVAFLMFEGKRWRVFVLWTLTAFLLLPTYMTGVPFDIVARIPIILLGFIWDLVFNSFFGIFKRNNRLVWLACISSAFYPLIIGPLYIITFQLYYPLDFAEAYAKAFFLTLPVSVIESVAGGFIGYKIYKRVKKLQS